MRRECLVLFYSPLLIKQRTRTSLCPPQKVYTGPPPPSDLIQLTKSKSPYGFNGLPPKQRAEIQCFASRPSPRMSYPARLNGQTSLRHGLHLASPSQSSFLGLGHAAAAQCPPRATLRYPRRLTEAPRGRRTSRRRRGAPRATHKPKMPTRPEADARAANIDARSGQISSSTLSSAAA